MDSTVSLARFDGCLLGGLIGDDSAFGSNSSSLAQPSSNTSEQVETPELLARRARDFASGAAVAAEACPG